MPIVISTLTVFFEDPFWIGIYERNDSCEYSVCKITFGSEPKDYEVLEFLLRHWHTLRFSPPIKAIAGSERHINPKRMQRLIQNQMRQSGMGTKAQQALKMQQEQQKKEHRVRSRKEKQMEQDRQFELRQEKRREKHRGH